MYSLHLLAFIILLFLYVLRICTEDRMQDTTTVYIDTIEAPKFRNTSCKCRILPSRNRANLVFRMINITQGSQLKFEIKGKVLDKMPSSHQLHIREITELMFTSHSAQTQQGACLTIYPNNDKQYQQENPHQEVKFTIDCKTVSTTETTTETMPVSNSTSQVTDTMSSLSSSSKSHTLSTQKQRSSTQTNVDPDNSTDNGSNGILDVDISFSFVDGIVPQSLSFGVNDNVLKSGQQHTFTMEERSLTLSVLTNDNYTYEGACLKVSSGRKITSDTLFNVTCEPTQNKSSTSIATSTPYPNSSVGKDKYINSTDKDEDNIIIPVVAASIAALVCIAVIILIVIICRRRSTKRNKLPKIANQGVTKKNNDDEYDDYYMTENPMYQTADTKRNIDNSDNEYLYAKSAKHKKKINTGDLKCNPDLKQFINKGNHHDHSTCVSSGQKRNPTVKAKPADATQNNNNSAVNDNTYETTYAASAQPFQGFNEYHHLSNAGTVKVAVVDVYNTIGNASKFPVHEVDEDVSHYHVANAR